MTLLDIGIAQTRLVFVSSYSSQQTSGREASDSCTLRILKARDEWKDLLIHPVGKTLHT